jgi:N-acetylglucosamine-6-sulfatase
MTKLKVLLVAVLLAATGLVACSGGADTSGAPAREGTGADGGAFARKPNIVRILTDDQDTSSLAVMAKTKKLLGERGVTYTDSVVSLSLCCPARATLLTGQYTHNHHVWDNGGKTGGFLHFENQENTLAPWLHEAGYETAHVGKYLNTYTKQQAGNVPAGWDRWFNVVDEARETYPYYGYTISDGGTSRKYGTDDKDYITDVFADRAVADLEAMTKSGKPFFLDFWPTAPHGGKGRTPSKRIGPVPAPKYESANADAAAPRTPNFLPEKNDIPEPLKVYGDLLRQANGGAAKYPALIDESYRDYLSSLLSVDDAVERLVKVLEDSGQLQNTLIIFTSDNGLMWGNHGLAAMKWEPYEESLRVPLIISGPGFPTGVTSDQPVANIDIVPTILAAAGVSPGRTVDGRRIESPAPERTGARAILIESSMFDPDQPYQFNSYKVPRFNGVRAGGYQYTEWTDGTVELYDLQVDPAQMKNVASDPSYAKDRAKLAEALQKLVPCVGESCDVTITGLRGR